MTKETASTRQSRQNLNLKDFSRQELLDESYKATHEEYNHQGGSASPSSLDNSYLSMPAQPSDKKVNKSFQEDYRLGKFAE